MYDSVFISAGDSHVARPWRFQLPSSKSLFGKERTHLHPQNRPTMARIIRCVVVVLGLARCYGFVTREASRKPPHQGDQPVTSHGFPTIQREPRSSRLYDSVEENNDSDKFGFFQRLESVKCLAIGGISGSVGFAPIGFLHDFVIEHSSLAQWEFDTDMAAIQGGLFAIVYRYCVRQDTNPQLNQGVIGAFVLTRTLSSIHVPSYCSAIPLDCEYLFFKTRHV